MEPHRPRTRRQTDQPRPSWRGGARRGFSPRTARTTATWSLRDVWGVLLPVAFCAAPPTYFTAAARNDHVLPSNEPCWFALACARVMRLRVLVARTSLLRMCWLVCARAAASKLARSNRRTPVGSVSRCWHRVLCGCAFTEKPRCALVSSGVWCCVESDADNQSLDWLPRMPSCASSVQRAYIPL